MHASRFSLAGRVAVVSGGSRGLGLAIAQGFVEAGASVALCARREPWLSAARDQLSAAGAHCFARLCDVTQEHDVNTFVMEALAAFGRLDILVNNAGISWAAPLEAMPLERWRAVLDTNLTGAFLMTKAVGAHLLAQRSGKVINIASLAGLVGLAPDILSAPAYSASKGALIALTRELAVKWGPAGIQVNAIAPGFFPTRLSETVIERAHQQIIAGIPLGRLGTERDIQDLATFLAAPASDYITGQVIALDGGATAL